MANSHQQEVKARRKSRAIVIAGPVAAFITASVVGVGVVTSTPTSTPEAVTPADSTPTAADLGSAADRGETVSRSAARSPLVPNAALSQRREIGVKPPTKADKLLDPGATDKALAKADSELYTTGVLNIWTHPGEKGDNLGELDEGKQVLVTGRSLFGRDEISFRDKSRWVTSGYLSADEPVVVSAEDDAASVSTGGTCTNGTSTSGGANVQAVHNAVCAAFPEIRVYGGIRGGGGDHVTGSRVGRPR